MTLPENFTAEVIIEMLRILPTTIIAGIVAYVAFQQWRTNKKQGEINQNRFNLELFEKRYEVFAAFSEFVKIVLLERYKFCDEAFHSYMMDIGSFDFVFGDDVCEFISEFNSRIIGLLESKDFDGFKVWFSQQKGENIHEMFKKYMDFRKL